MGLQIESLMIQIPSCSNSIVNFGPVLIWRQKSYCGSQFQSYFNLFSINFDNFWSLFRLNLTTFQLKDQTRWLWWQLKDRKVKLNRKSQFILSFLIKFDLFLSLSFIFNLFSNFLIKIGHGIINFVATINLDSKNLN